MASLFDPAPPPKTRARADPDSRTLMSPTFSSPPPRSPSSSRLPNTRTTSSPSSPKRQAGGTPIAARTRSRTITSSSSRTNGMDEDTATPFDTSQQHHALRLLSGKERIPFTPTRGNSLRRQRSPTYPGPGGSRKKVLLDQTGHTDGGADDDDGALTVGTKDGILRESRKENTSPPQRTAVPSSKPKSTLYKPGQQSSVQAQPHRPMKTAATRFLAENMGPSNSRGISGSSATPSGAGITTQGAAGGRFSPSPSFYAFSRPGSPNPNGGSSSTPTTPVIRARVTQDVRSRLANSSASSTPRGTGAGAARWASDVTGLQNAEEVIVNADSQACGWEGVGDESMESSASAVGTVPEAGTTMGKGKESVFVCVRIRPPRQDERDAWKVASSGALKLKDEYRAMASESLNREIQFDSILKEVTNKDVYKAAARDLVRSCMEGYDAVVFAYGQTASGKTFTLSGHPSDKGIISRSVADIFFYIRRHPDREFLLRASYLEIYNEVLRDLLDPAGQPRLGEDRGQSSNGVFVHPLREELVTSPQQIEELLARGQQNRAVGQTDWNERSSRSHACLQIVIESRARVSTMESESEAFLQPRTPGKARLTSKGGPVRVSQLSLIDLAGSEKYTGQADRRAEGAHINKSLLTLGTVIASLSDDKRKDGAHIPFRDSKLTRLLQNSLSGNARISVICTLSPSPAMLAESASTLLFAQRAKKVSVEASRNEVEDEKAVIWRYQKEIEELKRQVGVLKSEGDRTPVASPTKRSSESEVAKQEIQQRLQLLEKVILSSATVDEEESGETLPPRPVSPAKDEGFSFNDPPLVLQQKLYLAEQRISALRAELSLRPSVPADASPSSKDAHILQLEREMRELQVVVEGQEAGLAEAPRKIREDVEVEWKGKLEEEIKRREEAEAFAKEQTRELVRLKEMLLRLEKDNQQLKLLACQQTSAMVASLFGDGRNPSGSESANLPVVHHQPHPATCSPSLQSSAFPASRSPLLGTGSSKLPVTVGGSGKALRTMIPGPGHRKPRRSVSTDQIALLRAKHEKQRRGGEELWRTEVNEEGRREGPEGEGEQEMW